MRPYLRRLCVILGFVITITFAGPIMGSVEFSEAETQTVRPAVPVRIERLFASGECWTGAAPKEVPIPSHVVASRAGGALKRLGLRWTDKALRQVFHGEQHGLRIMGFCR